MTSSYLLSRAAAPADTLETAARLRLVRAGLKSVPGVSSTQDGASRGQEAHAFIDRLAELSPGAWLEFGRELALDPVAVARCRQARIALDSILADSALSIAAWRICDAVETLAFPTMRCSGKWTREQRRLVALAHHGAECAALALLSRDHLDEASAGALIGRFSTS